MPHPPAVVPTRAGASGALRRPPPVRRARDREKGVSMRLGTAIVLLALGAILTFALRVDVSGVDLQVVGWILMIVGALGIVLEVAVWGPRQRRRVTTTDGYGPPAPGGPAHRTTTDETYGPVPSRREPRPSRTGLSSCQVRTG